MNVRELYGKVVELRPKNKRYGLDMLVTPVSLPYFGMITSLKAGAKFMPRYDRPLTFYVHKGAVELRQPWQGYTSGDRPKRITCTLPEGYSVDVPAGFNNFSIYGLEETNDLFMFGPAACGSYRDNDLFPLTIKRPVNVPKHWGEEVGIVNNNQVTSAGYCGKILCMEAPKELQDQDGDITQIARRSSIHKHGVKAETLLVIKGKVRMEFFYYPKNTDYQSESFDLTEGQLVHIPPGLYHRFTGLTECAILEASTFHDDNDSYRLIPSGDVDIGPSRVLGNS